MYEELDPTLRDYADRLLEHAAAALWPERREALESFWRGMSRCSQDQHETAIAALGLELAEDADPAEVVFRLVLTAYLERLDEDEVTNPDQALIYSLSLAESHARLAEDWLADHPEHRAAP